MSWREHPHASFFFNDSATTEIYTLSLHDALPISRQLAASCSDLPSPSVPPCAPVSAGSLPTARDRKSTRLNSSHTVISYAVFCLKKKITILWFNSPFHPERAFPMENQLAQSQMLR